MSVDVSILISIVALLATFYQAYLQRRHNEKSVKPFPQITFDDYSHLVSVRLHNNGLGPLIIHGLAFAKGGKVYSSIKDCIDLDPKAAIHTSMDDLVERVILPDAYLTIFEKSLENHTQSDANRIRKQLAPITLKAECRDIYDNKITVQRDFRWFSRHGIEEAVGQQSSINAGR